MQRPVATRVVEAPVLAELRDGQPDAGPEAPEILPDAADEEAPPLPRRQRERLELRASRVGRSDRHGLSPLCRTDETGQLRQQRQHRPSVGQTVMLLHKEPLLFRQCRENNLQPALLRQVDEAVAEPVAEFGQRGLIRQRDDLERNRRVAQHPAPALGCLPVSLFRGDRGRHDREAERQQPQRLTQGRLGQMAFEHQLPRWRVRGPLHSIGRCETDLVEEVEGEGALHGAF